MADSDPHIHVEQNLGVDAARRDVVASLFGLVGDLPAVVTTGCQVRVGRAMTSSLPGRVTCLACREHARAQHLRHAEQIEALSGTAGISFSTAQARLAAQRHREMAAKFTS
jgi:hypothetical protein